MNAKNFADDLLKVWSQAKFDKEEIASQEQEAFPTLLSIARSSEKILEVGVGRGRMIKILKRNGVSADFYSIDITDHVKYAPGNRLKGDARALPFKDNVFNLVYSLGVIEHFPETDRAVKEHARVVKYGGIVFVTAPHLSPLGIYKRFLFSVRNVIEKRKGSFEIIVGKHFSVSRMKQFFMHAGLEILEMEGAQPVTPFRSSLEKLAQRLFSPQKWGGYIYCLARKTVREGLQST